MIKNSRSKAEAIFFGHAPRQGARPPRSFLLMNPFCFQVHEWMNTGALAVLVKKSEKEKDAC